MSSTTRGSTPMSRSRTMHRCSQPAGRPLVRAGGRTRGTRVLTVGWRTDDALHTALPIAARLRSHLHHARARTHCASHAQEVERYWNTRKPQSSARAVQRSYIEQVSHPARCPTPHGDPPRTVSHPACVPPRATRYRCSPNSSWGAPRWPAAGSTSGRSRRSGPVPYGAWCTVHGLCHILAAHWHVNCMVRVAATLHGVWCTSEADSARTCSHVCVHKRLDPCASMSERCVRALLRVCVRALLRVLMRHVYAQGGRLTLAAAFPMRATGTRPRHQRRVTTHTDRPRAPARRHPWHGRQPNRQRVA